MNDMIKVQKNSAHGVFQSGHRSGKTSRMNEIKAMMDPLVKHIDSTSGEGDLIELKKK